MADQKQWGILYGVSAGPGDPELITLKGYRILQETPVIAYPETGKGAASYAAAIIAKHVDSSQKQMLPLTFPMTKDPERLNREWGVAVKAVLEPLSAGKNVAFVSEGDALFYSTFIHLMENLKKEKPDLVIEVIPGVSSLHGAAASLAEGLVYGDEKFGVVPATNDRQAMSREIDAHDTIVFYKVAKVLPLVVDLLKEKNLAGQAVLVVKATSPEEKIYRDLNELSNEEIPYLSLVIVKKNKKPDHQ